MQRLNDKKKLYLHVFTNPTYYRTMHYCFIVNNEPGKSGNADTIRNGIESLKDPIDYEIYLTTKEKSATEFVRGYCKENAEQETCFVACGGDGTINEVATGMVGADNKHLAVLAYGSGNDFIKYYEGKDFRNIEQMVN